MKHLYNIDRLRVLSALGVVWFHTEGLPGRSYAYAGLPIFIMTYFMFIANAKSRDFSYLLNRKFKRIIIPWFFWSVVYGLVIVIKSILKKESCFESHMFLVGPSLHLWYLPYVFLLGALVLLIKNYVRYSFIFYYTISNLIFAFLLILTPLISRSFDLWTPFPQWLFGLSSVLMGLIAGFILMENNKYKFLIFLPLLLFLISILLNLKLGLGVRVTHVTAFTLFVLAFCFVGYETNLFERFLSSLTYGIYLVHPLIISIFNYMGFNSKVNIFVYLILVFMVSGILTYFLRKNKYTMRFI